MIMDFLRSQLEHTPLSFNNHAAETVNNIKFLKVQTSDDLTWSRNTTRFEENLNLPGKQTSRPTIILTTFCRAVDQMCCISAWYHTCNDWLFPLWAPERFIPRLLSTGLVNQAVYVYYSMSPDSEPVLLLQEPSETTDLCPLQQKDQQATKTVKSV
ncbi:hypothetical protein AMECASPLE_036571 [Ameca splendens]|uniref:Uncharacterized protein n=1 Tax=Ameca splendens TaxID=208324 RepID=A0ABV1AHF4_9TELE